MNFVALVSVGGSFTVSAVSGARRHPSTHSRTLTLPKPIILKLTNTLTPHPPTKPLHYNATHPYDDGDRMSERSWLEREKETSTTTLPSNTPHNQNNALLSLTTLQIPHTTQTTLMAQITLLHPTNIHRNFALTASCITV